MVEMRFGPVVAPIVDVVIVAGMASVHTVVAVVQSYARTEIPARVSTPASEIDA